MELFNMSVISILFVILHLDFSNGNLEQPAITTSSKALMYLSRFGYIDPSIMNSQSGNSQSSNIVDIKQSIMEFQAFAGLTQTGFLDEETIERMNTPRCGVKDKVGYGSNARKKRYALQGSRWKVKHLNYKITKYPKKLPVSDTDKDIKSAFKVWSDVTDLTFNKWVSGKVHIEVRFEVGEHGDGDPFDGRGGTLAHAYFPIYGGDAHFDDREIWTVDSYRGTNLLQVAAHEFGHSLGLSHSDVQSALMAPFYKGYEPHIVLDDDDLTGIQSLYGTKTFEVAPRIPTADPTTNYIPRTKPTSALCKDSSFDAITTLGNGNTYVFKGDEFWLLNDNGIADGYPKRIRTYFPNLPTKIDAAFTWTNQKTYFFKGGLYYRFNNFEMDEGYPKELSAGFNGIPSNVDGAFVWSGNGKIYFFKGRQYYKFDPDKRPPVAEKYPQDILIWEGIPNYIDDAFMYSNKFTYFFKNGKYWRFNDRSFKVDAAADPFPRSVGPWWFGCPESGSQMMSNNVNVTADEKTRDQDYVSGFVDTSPNEVSSPNDQYQDGNNYSDDDYDYWSSIADYPKPISYKKEKSNSNGAHHYPLTSLLSLSILLIKVFTN